MCTQCQKESAEMSPTSVSTEQDYASSDTSSSPIKKAIKPIPAVPFAIPTTGLLSKICAITAFILTLLCLFAGSSTGFLDQVDIMTVNTSTVKPAPTLAGMSASEMGVKDFYSIHVMSFCEGYDINLPGGATTRNVTYCSKRSAIFEFDPSRVLASDMNSGFNISDLTWPSTIDDDFKFLSATTKAVSTLYVIGATATGIKVLMELFLLTAGGGRPSMLAHLLLTVFSFVTIGISSTLASVIAVRFVELINLHGSGFGITASGGSSFLGMSWSAVILLFISTAVGVATLPPSCSCSNDKQAL